jgi:hypothetical protein
MHLGNWISRIDAQLVDAEGKPTREMEVICQFRPLHTSLSGVGPPCHLPDKLPYQARRRMRKARRFVDYCLRSRAGRSYSSIVPWTDSPVASKFGILEWSVKGILFGRSSQKKLSPPGRHCGAR